LKYKKEITKEFIFEIHKFVVSNTLRPELINQIGRYRKVQVYIGASLPPSPKNVPIKMATLLRWYSINKKRLHPLVIASYFHTEFEKIHPFIEGNGRTGRLLMNFILHKNNFPMINIPHLRKHKYYETLHKAHAGDIKPFVNFLIELLKETTLKF
jgi:Fic family protein